MKICRGRKKRIHFLPYYGMPKNKSGTHQSAMTQIISDLLHNICEPYVHDLLVF